VRLVNNPELCGLIPKNGNQLLTARYAVRTFAREYDVANNGSLESLLWGHSQVGYAVRTFAREYDGANNGSLESLLWGRGYGAFPTVWASAR